MTTRGLTSGGHLISYTNTNDAETSSFTFNNMITFLINIMTRKLTNDGFITKAKIIHGEKYNYDKVSYITSQKKVTISCSIHGDFEQTPNSHLHGAGCRHCGILSYSNSHRGNTDAFIRNAIIKHNNRYNYSNVDYRHRFEKVQIKCKDHGPFQQTPDNHLKGKGCPWCSGNKRYTTEEFIERAKTVHNDKYDYSKVVYKNSYTKVTIVCVKHGEFSQQPGSHLYGTGCPHCDSSKGELAIRSILQKHSISFIQEYKLPGNNYQFRYDFYLPDHNLLIEFHGGQHYKPIEHFGGMEYFKYVQKCDLFKKALAREYRIPIVFFNYKDLKLKKEKFEKMIMRVLSRR